MSVITKMLRQKAVYWAPGSVNAFGEIQLGIPTEVKCRWEDKHDEFIDSQGETVVSNAVVFVDSNLAVGGYLWLGNIGVAPLDPKKDAYLIRKFEKLPNFKATEYLRTAML